MKLLAIDTSTAIATFALSTGSEVLSESKEGVRQHAQFILPIIEALLSKAELSISSLDGIVFGRGPGSFTGLRVACSVAKALAYAHDFPVYPVSTLASIAYQATHLEPSNESKACLAVLDARMNQIYWGLFLANEFNVTERVSDANQMVIPDIDSVILAGVGYESYKPLFSDALRPKIKQEMVVYPNAQAMINLVESGHIESKTPSEAMPVYIRNQVTHGGKGG